MPNDQDQMGWVVISPNGDPLWHTLSFTELEAWRELCQSAMRSKESFEASGFKCVMEHEAGIRAAEETT